MGDIGHPPELLETIRTAFGCGDALGLTIAGLARQGAHGRGAMLWPLPDRDETTLLLAGFAQEVAYGRDGTMLVLLPLGPGDFYGSLVGMSDGDTRIEAVSSGAAAHFSDAAVMRLMEGYAIVAVAITRHLAARLTALRRRMVEAAMLSATGRIAAELLRRSGQGEGGIIRPMPVFAELAASVQSTRETVSRTVSQWEKRGLLRRVEGGLQVVARHRLEDLVY